MKITKKQSVKASEELTSVIEETIQPTECKYQSAIDLINAAIESLAEIAKDDVIAKESIANLGVVMFDLKGGCA